MFKVVEEKTVSFTFNVHDAGDVAIVTVNGDRESVEVFQDECLTTSGTPAEVAKALRAFADSLTKVASKLEGIK